MASMHDSGYDDLSFILQNLDNTGTTIKVDHQLLRIRTEEGKLAFQIEDEAAAHISRRIVDLQIYGEAIKRGSQADQITIYKDAIAFVAQFSIDVRDKDNRLTTVLCFGRLPRASYDDADRRGIQSLRTFLESNEIEWTMLIKNRYLVVYRELTKGSDSGFNQFVKRLRLPHLRPPSMFDSPMESEPIVRLGPHLYQDKTRTTSGEDVPARSGGAPEEPSTSDWTHAVAQPAAPTPSAPDDMASGEDVPARSGGAPEEPSTTDWTHAVAQPTAPIASAADSSVGVTGLKRIAQDMENRPIKARPQEEAGSAHTKSGQEDSDVDPSTVPDSSAPKRASKVKKSSRAEQ